jgi:carbon monoxide dehydrogenase subunit G
MKKLTSIILFTFVFCVFMNIKAQATVQSVQANRGAGSGKTQFTINYPITFVRKVLSSDKLFMQLIPGVVNWKVLQNGPSTQTARCTMALGKFSPPASYTVQVNKISQDEVRFKRLSGDLKNLEGSWSLAPVGDSTRVTYFYKVDTGIKLAPNLIMEKELRRHLLETEAKTFSQIKKIYAATKATEKSSVQISTNKASASDN